MIVFVAALFGAIWGANVAKKREGNRLDIAQYAAGYGIASGLVAYFALLALGVLLA